MGKQDLYLLQYNNYYNRIIKKYQTLDEYLVNEQILASYQEINFNPNDGVNTEHILRYDGVEPDYMLVYDLDTGDLSRWFITEAKRERGSQYRYILHRDLIADNYEEVVNAPVFIEKATINDPNDPALFNNENMSFNQIKQSETLLRDSSKVAWVVGYVARDAALSNISIPSLVTEADADIVVPSLSQWQYYNKIGVEQAFQYDWQGTFRSNLFIPSIIAPQNLTTTFKDYIYNTTVKKVSVEELEGLTFTSNIPLEGPPFIETTIHNLLGGNNTLKSYLDSAMKTSYNYSTSNLALNDLNNKLIYDQTTGLYWKIKVSYKYKTATLNNSALNNYTRGALDYKYALNTDYVDNFTVQYDVAYSSFTLSLVQEVNSVTLNIKPADQRRHLSEAPYDMFCIPYGEINVKDSNEPFAEPYRTNANIAIEIGQQILAQVGSDNFYDIQLLPYCPCRHLLKTAVGQDEIDITNDTSASIVTDADGNKVSVLIWCTSNEIDFRMEGAGPTLLRGSSDDALERKINNETDLWRLCSPNYNGAFEFSVEKNNSVTAWNITCTYKPYNPYIKVSPSFRNLYGSDFSDARGLICGGDFSLSRITSAWADYELRNKNYQAVFDRQIEHMEVNNSVARTQQAWGIATGAVGAATSGAMTGAMVGGGWGAAIGGVVAGGTSLAGGIADYQLSETLRNEALDYTKDQFGYNLQNIQALPYGLGKVGAFNANNKIFPFIEYYTCTEVEKQALRDKIKYNGMTVMRIGNIQSFIQSEPTYIKGKLIRLENIGDYHIVNAISGELDKGVFI